MKRCGSGFTTWSKVYRERLKTKHLVDRNTLTAEWPFWCVGSKSGILWRRLESGVKSISCQCFPGPFCKSPNTSSWVHRVNHSGHSYACRGDTWTASPNADDSGLMDQQIHEVREGMSENWTYFNEAEAVVPSLAGSNEGLMVSFRPVFLSCYSNWKTAN